MHAFSLDAFVKGGDGILRPFSAGVSGPIRRGRGFVCDVTCSLWGKRKSIRSAWPETAYSEACNAVRFLLQDMQLSLRNARGRRIEFGPPLILPPDPGGSQKRLRNFPSVRFHGYAAGRKGVSGEIVFAVASPKHLKSQGLYAVFISSNWPGFRISTKSHWPDQAYALAFSRIRAALEYKNVQFVSDDGKTLRVAAPE